VIPRERSFEALLGLEIVALDEHDARARLAVHDGVMQPFGLVHGGVYAAIAESLASRATLAAVYAEGLTVVGLSNHASFLRPIAAGHVNALARCRHRGRTTWVWEVDMTDDEGRLCSIARVTLAVRLQPEADRSQAQPE